MSINWINKDLVTILKFCLLGILLLCLFFFLLDYGVKHSSETQTGKVNKIIDHSVDPLTMIFGSSVSEVGFNTAILQEKTGGTVYNCSLNGTRFVQNKALINEFESYSKNNKYVILAEAYFSFEEFNLIMFPERFLAHINNQSIYSTFREIQPGMAWRCRYIPFYKYTTIDHVYYMNALAGWKNIIRGTAVDTSLGFFPVERNWENDADEKLNKLKPFVVPLNSSVLQKYVQSITSLQNKGKRVIIVLSPVYEMAIKNVTDINPLRSKLKEVAASTGCKFLDFSDSWICMNKAFFYNSTHLNKKGADEFSKILGDSLKIEINRPGKIFTD